jgi:hypothetical protein
MTCWQILLLSVLVLSATSTCSDLVAHCVCIISCNIITALLWREINYSLYKNTLFWDVMPYSLVDTYRFLQIIGTYLPDFTVSHLWKQCLHDEGHGNLWSQSCMFANTCISVTLIVKAYIRLDTERSKEHMRSHMEPVTTLCFDMIDWSCL